MSDHGEAPIHATTVARYVQGRRGGGRWIGVLLTGPSGAGKSDLALRLMAEGWRLVADDYSQVWRSGDALWATAPIRIGGLVEARGLGVISAPAPVRPLTRLSLAIACSREAPDRLPEPAFQTIAGVALPLVSVDIRTASATVLVALALEAALDGPLSMRDDAPL